MHITVIEFIMLYVLYTIFRYIDNDKLDESNELNELNELSELNEPTNPHKQHQHKHKHQHKHSPHCKRHPHYPHYRHHHKHSDRLSLLYSTYKMDDFCNSDSESNESNESCKNKKSLDKHIIIRTGRHNTINMYNYYNTTSSDTTNTTPRCPYPQNSLTFSDPNPTKPIIIRFNKSVMIEVDLVAGGGAGGIGHAISNFYFYGGGGGTGQHINKRVMVNAGDEWTLSIGAGGSSKNGTCGCDTVISIVRNNNGCGCCVTPYIIALGGQNGFPNTSGVAQMRDVINSILQQQSNSTSNVSDNKFSDFKNIVAGGASGRTLSIQSKLNPQFKLPYSCQNQTPINKCDNPCNDNGGDGGPGQVAAPSINGTAGNGGEINKTGPGGQAGTPCVVTGSDGQFGSGGGGSQPYILDICTEKFSGNGGNGYITITVINTDTECMTDCFSLI